MSAVSEKRVALIGAGERGRCFARALADAGELALRAVVDPDRSAARALASAAGHVRAFGSVEALLDAGQVPDVAVICVPSALHLELAAPLLVGGADVLLEPPLATTRGDAERLTELAERLGRVLLCGSALAAGVRAAGLHRSSNELGKLGRVEIELARKRDARAPWRGDPALSGGGVLMHLGPAALELAELLAGPLAQIRVLESDRLQRAEVEDAVRLETAHEGGATGQVLLSWNEAETRPFARCTAERGDRILGAARSALHAAGSSAFLESPLDERECRSALLRALLERRLIRDAICDEGARTLGWLHAAYRSRELGRWQYVY
jgi:predicted dehydrogenase